MDIKRDIKLVINNKSSHRVKLKNITQVLSYVIVTLFLLKIILKIIMLPLIIG